MNIQFEDIILEFIDPQSVDFDRFHGASDFYKEMYTYLYSQITEDIKLFCLDFDLFDKQFLINLIERYNVRVLKRSNGKSYSLSEWNKDVIRKSFQLFFCHFPDFALLIKNIHPEMDITIKNAERLNGSSLTAENFLNIKVQIDRINRMRWSRGLTPNEKQAGVSILGGISEKLVEVAMDKLIDGRKFLRNLNQDVQSYGDFVLMCLPNNLWISVKSNYARERLLASGFSSDIIGVGFFTDYKEFTSRSRIRNFLKVGFLAMYIPDVAITEKQMESGISTYEEIQNYYSEKGINLPININGKAFIRPLSQLYHDLSKLIEIEDISRRTVIDL